MQNYHDKYNMGLIPKYSVLFQNILDVNSMYNAYTGCPKTIPLRIFRRDWILFFKIRCISMSFNKEISILCFLVIKLQARQYLKKCFSEKKARKLLFFLNIFFLKS